VVLLAGPRHLIQRGHHHCERSLRLLWVDKGYLIEGRRWLEAALEATDDLPTAARAKALGTAALLSALQGDWPQTKRWASEGRRLSLQLGEDKYAGWSMLPLGRAMLAEGGVDPVSLTPSRSPVAALDAPRVARRAPRRGRDLRNLEARAPHSADRRLGTSKMSRRIIFEALGIVLALRWEELRRGAQPLTSGTGAEHND